MARDECRKLGCSREPGQSDKDTNYNKRLFCSPECEVKHDHIKMDAQDAMRDERPDTVDRRDLPECDGPPY
jgi:hypothetical protein